MARYYARFNHGFETTLGGTGSVANFFERRVIGATTSSNAFLIAKREALSNAMYAQLNAGSRDPDVGPIIPQQSNPTNIPVTQNITRTGGQLSWQKVYKTTTIPGVVPPADFRTRPTASVYTDDGNVTELTPTDPGSISDTLYTDATDALNTVLTSIKKTKSGLTPIGHPFTYTEDGSPFTRLGTNPSRTLHSIWHDRDLNYFAWDDFTPGQPQTFTYKFPTADAFNTVYLEEGDPLTVVLQWTPEFLSDRAGDTLLYFRTERSDNSTIIDTINDTISDPPLSPTNGLPYYSASLTAVSYGTIPPGYQYNINSSVQFRDATISVHTGPVVENNVSNGVKIVRVYPITGIGPYATAEEVCGATTTTQFYNDGAISIVGSQYLYTTKQGTFASAGLYRDPGGGSYLSWDGAYPPLGVFTCPEGTGGNDGSGGGIDPGLCNGVCITNGDCTDPNCPNCTGGICVGQFES